MWALGAQDYLNSPFSFLFLLGNYKHAGKCSQTALFPPLNLSRLFSHNHQLQTALGQVWPGCPSLFLTHPELSGAGVGRAVKVRGCLHSVSGQGRCNVADKTKRTA